MVLDQALFHTTERITVPEGIHLLLLPPKSPELQPAERLWPSINESLDELEDVIARRCRTLIERTDLI